MCHGDAQFVECLSNSVYGMPRLNPTNWSLSIKSSQLGNVLHA